MVSQPSSGNGRANWWLSAIKGLTFTNALVIIMLLVSGTPAYLMYKVVNSERMLDHFTSIYREIPSSQAACAFREAKSRFGAQTWKIVTGFAYQGDDRWSVMVSRNLQPSSEQVVMYCSTLLELVTFIRGLGGMPSFPGTDQPLVPRIPLDGKDR